MFKFSLFFVLGTLALANTIVVPNSQTTATGNGVNNLGVPAGSDIRYQGLYGSDQFSSIGSPIEITGFSFRVAPGTGAFSLTVSNADIYLSTSPNYPNNTGHPFMSTTFSNNIGPDNTLVYSGAFNLSSSGCSTPGPCPFDLLVTFTTPFYYNFANGPLLLDMMITDFTAGSGSSLDGEGFAYPPGGSIVANNRPIGQRHWHNWQRRFRWR